MSILDEVLIEEYNRSENIKLCYLDKLTELSSEQQEERDEVKVKIQAIEFDQRKIRAALEVAGINIADHIEPRRLFNMKVD